MTARDERGPLCERRFAVSAALAFLAFFASVVLGSLAARAVVPGSGAAPTLGAFMLPLGWALGWLGPRHLALACATLLAPVLLPLLLLWLLWRLVRGHPRPLGDAPPPGWRPDPTVFLIVPACAVTCALTGAVSAWQADAPVLRAAGLLAPLGLGWGALLATLMYRGVLPDETPDDGAAVP